MPLRVRLREARGTAAAGHFAGRLHGGDVLPGARRSVEGVCRGISPVRRTELSNRRSKNHNYSLRTAHKVILGRNLGWHWREHLRLIEIVCHFRANTRRIHMDSFLEKPLKIWM